MLEKLYGDHVFIVTIYRTYSRDTLKSLHFNENVQRETGTGKDGKPYYKVSYTKFKLGEKVVREVTVPPTYGE